MQTDDPRESLEDNLKHLTPDALIARIRELQSRAVQDGTRIAELSERIEQLEELFRLAQLNRKRAINPPLARGVELRSM
jgi:transposase